MYLLPQTSKPGYGTKIKSITFSMGISSFLAKIAPVRDTLKLPWPLIQSLTALTAERPGLENSVHPRPVKH